MNERASEKERNKPKTVGQKVELQYSKITKIAYKFTLNLIVLYNVNV